jgi:hypothetical protein
MPRRSNAGPTSSMLSSQPPNAAETTGTTVWPITGMNPTANSRAVTSTDTTISAADCRTARAAPLASGSASSGTDPNSRSTDSDSLS